MEMFRNAEVMLMLCFGVLCAAVGIGALSGPAQPRSGLEAAQAPPAMPMAVVVIKGKRLSAAEKQADTAAEGRAG